jgi:hypothetical protein
MPVRARNEYQLVSAEDNVQAEKASLALQSALPKNYHRAVLWLCILSTFTNLAIFCLSLRQASPTPNLNRDAIRNLRRPSQYIGFDTIPRPAPPTPKNFSNYPFLLTQVDASQPNKILPPSTKKYLALSGTVYPDDKKLLVADKV